MTWRWAISQASLFLLCMIVVSPIACAHVSPWNQVRVQCRQELEKLAQYRQLLCTTALDDVSQ